MSGNQAGFAAAVVAQATGDFATFLGDAGNGCAAFEFAFGA